MNRFLDDYIDTLTTRRARRVADLLEEAKVAKDQLDLISARLANLGQIVPLVLSQENAEAAIEAANFEINFRDAFTRIQELYEVSNLVSLLLDSHQSILGSDVKAIEDHLASLEKMAANYSFLLADGGAFNYAYLEPFSDERGRETGLNFNIPDRASQLFGPAEQAVIRTDEGVLALPESLSASHPMAVSVVKGNATAFVTSDTGIQNVLSANTTTGWRMTLASANPITSGLPEAGGAVGAQVILEFTLAQPAPASEIKLVPFADMALDLVQVTLYPKLNDDSNFTTLLSAPTPLDRPYSLFFPMQSVAKFRVLLSQSIYNRLASLISVPEQNYQRLLKEIADRDKDRYNIGRVLRIHKIQKYIIKFRKRKGRVKKVFIALPHIDFHPHWGPMRIDKVIQQFQKRLGPYDIWGRQEHFEQALLRLFKKNPFMHHRVFFRKVGKYEEVVVSIVDNSTSPVTTLSPALNPPVIHQGFYYQYNLGLHYVSIGSNAPGFKGVFVSRTMPAPGDIGEVRLKVSEANSRLSSTDRQSSLLTSVEYSVSNESEPKAESDWIPILPSNALGIVEAERLFPDSAGRAFFRFEASEQGYLVLYRNGYKVSGFNLIFNALKDGISGLSLPNGTYTSDDIFTVDYVPAADHSTVNFENSGFADIPLVAAHDATGAGEGFSTSGGRDTVDLTYEPYIDYDQVLTSTYSDSFGLTPYQPITIRFDNGSNAFNLTNYRHEDQASLPAPDEGYYYIHSGNTIQFNQNVNIPFRVYYQYLQNNIRVRVVLRVNAKTFTSPSVDYFHLKAKTRRSDALGA